MTTRSWVPEALARPLERVRALLAGEATDPDGDAAELPPGLTALTAAFGLDPFERDVLLWCAGAALDTDLAELGEPSFGRALEVFPGGSWRALAPTAPLRTWRLVELQMGAPLPDARLQIDERVLHHLLGTPTLDARLMPYLRRMAAPAWVPPALAARVEEIAGHYLGPAAGGGRSEIPPVMLLAGARTRDAALVAALACVRLGVRLHSLPLSALPGPADQRDTFRRLWERETLLAPSALLVEASGDEALAGWLADASYGPVFVTGVEALTRTLRPVVRQELGALSVDDRRHAWRRALGGVGVALNGRLDETITHFAYGLAEVEHASAAARRAIRGGEQPEHAVWQASRSLSRPRMGELAQRIEPVADWRRLVLPERELGTLRLIAANVRRRHRVHHEWGFAEEGSRGAGIAALFCGPSGTGKTLAAEVLARELELDLYRIDLSAVVSKYIGETEKNLRAVFDAADAGGAILLFDEADALFGKRSEVHDSHDRYANIEVSYLLQRMESYRGLAILTTNMRTALDDAFLRRLRFIVQFPFPSAEQRARIWRTVFPQRAQSEGLDPRKLARLTVTGGHIRNIALAAAFLAADEDLPIRMTHVRRAAESEYAKLERTLTPAELRGWS